MEPGCSIGATLYGTLLRLSNKAANLRRRVPEAHHVRRRSRPRSRATFFWTSASKDPSSRIGLMVLGTATSSKEVGLSPELIDWAFIRARETGRARSFERPYCKRDLLFYISARPEAPRGRFRPLGADAIAALVVFNVAAGLRVFDAFDEPRPGASMPVFRFPYADPGEDPSYRSSASVSSSPAMPTNVATHAPGVLKLGTAKGATAATIDPDSAHHDGPKS
jgi:hypothetical protein